MSWSNRVMNLFLSLGVGAMLASTIPAFADSSRSRTVVRVSQPGGELKRIRYTAPEYPAKAVQRRVSGFVTIEFVINKKGEPTGLKVIDAQPAEIFDRAVLSAAKRWRYRPTVVDKAPTEVPTRTIVRFETL